MSGKELADDAAAEGGGLAGVEVADGPVVRGTLRHTAGRGRLGLGCPCGSCCGRTWTWRRTGRNTT